MLGILPIFILEEGLLAPLEKVHSLRSGLEYFEEFLDEFEFPRQVALTYGTGVTRVKISPLRQHIQEVHPASHFSEQPFSPHLEALLGPQSFGMAIMQ
jgi:fatty acid-binding protein DegV